MTDSRSVDLIDVTLVYEDANSKTCWGCHCCWTQPSGLLCLWQCLYFHCCQSCSLNVFCKVHPVPTIHSSGTCRTLLDPCLSGICSQVFCTCLWEYVRPQFRLGTLTQYKEKAAKLREVPLGLFIYPVLQVPYRFQRKGTRFYSGSRHFIVQSNKSACWWG